MTIEEKIAMVNILSDEYDEDKVTTYLTIAGQKIIARAYPFDTTITEVPTRYDMLQCEIATYLILKRGAEGQTIHAENGIHRHYESADVPESMLGEVVPFSRAIGATE